MTSGTRFGTQRLKPVDVDNGAVASLFTGASHGGKKRKQPVESGGGDEGKQPGAKKRVWGKQPGGGGGSEPTGCKQKCAGKKLCKNIFEKRNAVRCSFADLLSWQQFCHVSRSS